MIMGNDPLVSTETATTETIVYAILGLVVVGFGILMLKKYRSSQDTKKEPLLGPPQNSEWTKQEETALKKAEDTKPGSGTFSSSVFLLFNSAVGAGVLALPYCVLMGGIVPTTLAITFFGFITGLSSVAIVATQEISNSRDYQSIVKHYLGMKASSVMSTIIATYCLLNCVGALVIIADQSGPVLQHFFGKSDVWWMQRDTHVMVGAMMAFPLMCLKEITSLKFTALMALAGTIFIVLCVVQQTLAHSSSDLEEKYGDVHFFPPAWSTLLLALPSCCLAYQNQMQVPNIYAELRPELKNLKTMSMIIATSIVCLILPMYLGTAIAGYFMFREQTPSDVLVGPYAQTETQIFAARMLLCVNAVFRVPVNHFTARSAMYTLWQRYSGKPFPESQTTFSGTVFWAEIFVYSCIMVGLGMVLNSLATVLDIMSATCAMAVMFFMPALFLFKGKSQFESKGWQYLASAFMVVGASVAVVSTYAVIESF
jgi:amino acid permease